MKNLTQFKFAKAIGISPSFLSELESGKTKPSLPIVYTIEYKFGYRTEWIFTGDGDMYLGTGEPPFLCTPQKFELYEEGYSPPLEAADTNTKTLEDATDQSAPVIQGTYQSEFRVSEALTMCARVLESGTSYATALYLNIQHFDRAVSAEARIATVEKGQADIETRSRDFEQKMQAEMAEMRTIITTLQNENRELRKEVNRLKATYENPDGSGDCLTNTSGNE